jgi:hypothetical protein
LADLPPFCPVHENGTVEHHHLGARAVANDAAEFTDRPGSVDSANVVPDSPADLGSPIAALTSRQPLAMAQSPRRSGIN